MGVSEFLSATPNELVRRYGAVRKDNFYEVPLQNVPWTFWRPLSATLVAGMSYSLSGLDISWSGPGEIYVVLTDWEVGYGYILAQRRRLFSCIRRPYSAPYGVRLPPQLRVKPVELVLSDSNAITCVDRSIEVRALAVLPSTSYVLSTLKVDLSNAKLQVVGRNL